MVQVNIGEVIRKEELSLEEVSFLEAHLLEEMDIDAPKVGVDLYMGVLKYHSPGRYESLRGLYNAYERRIERQDGPQRFNK